MQERATNYKSLGVSVHHLETVFLERLAQAPFHLNGAATIYELEGLDGDSPGLIRSLSLDETCPIDERPGSAYVHCLEGSDHVGEATHMLSYSWQYSIGDIVDSLVAYCESADKNPKRTYIWICCLCINQHRVAEQKRSGMTVISSKRESPAVNFFVEFGGRVTRIGHMLAMMTPWNNPGYLQRIWCIFELATSIKSNCLVTIVMPPQEKLALQQDLFGDEGKGADALYESFSKTRVQMAKASVESDRRAILCMVRESPGYAVLNQRVNGLLRQWVKSTIQEAVRAKIAEREVSVSESDDEDRSLDLAKFFSQVCRLSSQNGDYDIALEIVNKAIGIHKEQALISDIDNQVEYSQCLHNLGYVLMQKGRNKDAIDTLQQALAILEAQLGVDHLKTADTYDLIGSAFSKNGNYDQALGYIQKALATRLRTLGQEHASTARSYGKMGHVLYFKKDYSKALLEYQRELTVCEKVYGSHHPSTADAINNTGAALKHIGNHQLALKQHRKALAIRESVLGMEHPDTAKSINNVGSVLFHMGEYDQALQEYRKALDLRRSVLGEEHPYTAASYFNIATVLEAKDDLKGAIVQFQNAYDCQVKILGVSHPNTSVYQERLECVQAQVGETNLPGGNVNVKT